MHVDDLHIVLDIFIIQMCQSVLDVDAQNIPEFLKSIWMLTQSTTGMFHKPRQQH